MAIAKQRKEEGFGGYRSVSPEAFFWLLYAGS